MNCGEPIALNCILFQTWSVIPRVVLLYVVFRYDYKKRSDTLFIE
jgi:hypothetical protein